MSSAPCGSLSCAIRTGPARWQVTFSVDDTDASVARAAELGAEVLVQPHDAGPVRIAQLRDPQGAELTISRYDGG